MPGPPNRAVRCAKAPFSRWDGGGFTIAGWGMSESLQRKSDRQFGARVHLSEQNVGNRVRSAAARIPRLQNAAYLVGPRHQGGTARFQDHNRMRIRGRNLLDQRILVLGKRKGGKIHALALPLTDKNNGNIGSPSQSGSRSGICAGIVFDLCMRRFCAQSFQRRGRKPDFPPPWHTLLEVQGAPGRRVHLA